jgi:hypothetical protein
MNYQIRLGQSHDLADKFRSVSISARHSLIIYRIKCGFSLRQSHYLSDTTKIRTGGCNRRDFINGGEGYTLAFCAHISISVTSEPITSHLLKFRDGRHLLEEDAAGKHFVPHYNV